MLGENGDQICVCHIIVLVGILTGELTELCDSEPVASR